MGSVTHTGVSEGKQHTDNTCDLDLDLPESWIVKIPLGKLVDTPKEIKVFTI